MKYISSLGFYFFELAAGISNFLCCLVGVYPSFDWGVNFLLFFEGKRIRKEQISRQALRVKREVEADSLKNKAEDDG